MTMWASRLVSRSSTLVLLARSSSSSAVCCWIPPIATTTTPDLLCSQQRKPSRRRSWFLRTSRTFAASSSSEGAAGASAVPSSLIEDQIVVDNITILEQTDHYLVVAKPPAVVCHHSYWAGSRGSDVPEVPMLQRVRDQIGRRVNLVHRLDRGASGCLLLTYADDGDADDAAKDGEATENSNATAILSNAMADKTVCTKTYLALVRGEGILHDRRFQDEGWLLVDRPIKNENGNEKNATTWFRFLAGQDNDRGRLAAKARASLVLARPETGRWHQIRKHLRGLSHPILGDTTHGCSRSNREWREQRGMPPARTCLHLCRLQIAPIPSVCPDGIDVTCPLPPDMMRMLTEQLPNVLAEAEPKLRDEGILLF